MTGYPKTHAGSGFQVALLALLVPGLSATMAAAKPPASQEAGRQVGVRLEAERLVILVDGDEFTSYKFSSEQKYPYFWPVIGPASGLSITTESSEPYPHHHSLFFGCDRVNGANFWQNTNERGQIVSEGPRIIEATGRRVVFTDACRWRRPGRSPVMADERRVTVTAPAAGLRLIDFEITLRPLVEITIEKTNHSLFSARVIPEMSVASSGTLRNAEGALGEKGTWGIPSAWCDYSAPRPPREAGVGGAKPQEPNTSAPGATEGIAILQHPENRWFPSRWFTRDYGFFSPTPMFWLEGDRLVLPEGKPVTLRYQVVVHTGDAEAAGIARLFADYAGTAGMKRDS